MEDNVKVKVLNRAGNGTVCYNIPDMGNLQRTFSDGEEKILTFEELRKLSYVSGGDVLLKEYLIVEDKDVLKELNIITEPEYFYTKDDVIRLMTTGSLDEFLDCLDFAPEGVLETIKELSVSLPLNDVAKRKAILEKMGFDVDNAVKVKELTEAEDNESESNTRVQRRAAAPKDGKNQSETGKTARRVIITK